MNVGETPYEPIAPDELVEPERKITLPGRDAAATTRLLARLPDVAAYGFLLAPDDRHPVAAVVRDRWSELDHRSGRRFAIVAFQPPATWARALVDRWRVDLGPEFEQTWRDWQDRYGFEAGAAYDYLDYFQTTPPLRAADLPCLVIFCSLDDRRAIVRPIPEWTPDETFDFLGGVIDEVVERVDLPLDQRLEELRDALTSPGVRLRSTLGHLTGRAVDYCKAHPATVVTSVLSVAMALGTANVLPLSANVVMAIGDVRDIFK